MTHYEIQQFHRQCLRMVELLRSRTLDRRDVDYLDGSLETVKAEIEVLFEGERRREATMITDGRQRASCPERVWDGPYSYICGMGGVTGICGTHGRFR